jgi:hypothetical protein
LDLSPRRKAAGFFLSRIGVAADAQPFSARSCRRLRAAALPSKGWSHSGFAHITYITHIHISKAGCLPVHFFSRLLAIDLVGMVLNEAQTSCKSLIYLYAAISKNRLNNRCDHSGNARQRFSGVAPRTLLLIFHSGPCIRLVER